MMHYMEVPHNKKTKQKMQTRTEKKINQKKTTDLPVRVGTVGKKEETKKKRKNRGGKKGNPRRCDC